ncbi:amidase family protein [Altererythrobacter lutimaris]|uniref:Amidase n=1 Tax=Altererythrobacter lutimaris TaxID=2743979 RepID=A0A850HB43_9SPHN|nr:amidase family protein [Altererythrobacter lutimaris]NVE94126.1 amidase [Altererythrobacter lutimaris]
MAYPRLTKEPGALRTAAAIKAGTLSPLEAVDAAIARIEQLNAPLNAVVVQDFDRARETAKALEHQGPDDNSPLFGVPMTVKESYDVAGLPTTFGIERYKDTIATRDSRVVEKLKAAGAIIIGKTNVPAELTDWQSNNPVYGRTNNPHDHGRSPGGSSGGSAAAVASGMVACEFGSDIGGSIRVPAHFCGVWGHKPSWGLISKRGHSHPAFAGKPTHDGALSVCGPLARSGEDIAALMQVTAEHVMPSNAKPLSECRLLLVTHIEGSPVDYSVGTPLEDAMAKLEPVVVRVDRESALLPDLAKHHRNYMRMMNTAMARGAPDPKGNRATATDWFNLLDAQAECEAEWQKLLEEYDFVLAPPAPVLATEHVEGSLFKTDVSINTKMVSSASGLAWAGVATLPNLPSTVLPIGTFDNLPCGMQVIGPRWRDLDCIHAAIAIDEIVNG